MFNRKNSGKLLSLLCITALICLVALPAKQGQRIFDAAVLWGSISKELVKSDSASIKVVGAVATAEIKLPIEKEICDPNERLVSASQLFQEKELEAFEQSLSLQSSLELRSGEACENQECGSAAYERRGARTPAPTPRPANPDLASCRINLNSQIDECGVSESGSACSGRSTPKNITDDRCCDWTLKEDGSRSACSCNTSVVGPTMDESICSACMLIAEASTETDIWCKQMVLCTMRERKKWNDDDNQCVTNARKTGNGTWFTPDKCTCDSTSPNRQKNPNHQYCECRAALNEGGTYPRYQEFYEILTFQCPAESPNFYNNNCGNPCSNGGREISPPRGVTCKHKFYRCNTP